MFSKKRLTALAGAILLLTAMAQRSSADEGQLTVGAWFGKVFIAPNVGFPFQAVFNADRTWTGTDARGFGQIPGPFPFSATGTTFSGSWVKTGDSTYEWTGTQILLNPSGNSAPAGYYVLVVHGSHQVSPHDANHMTNGQAGAKVFPCGPTAFGCPDPDAILSDPAPFPPTFAFALSRVLPKPASTGPEGHLNNR
jgi:hypothetical protein